MQQPNQPNQPTIKQPNFYNPQPPTPTTTMFSLLSHLRRTNKLQDATNRMDDEVRTTLANDIILVTTEKEELDTELQQAQNMLEDAIEKEAFVAMRIEKYETTLAKLKMSKRSTTAIGSSNGTTTTTTNDNGTTATTMMNHSGGDDNDDDGASNEKHVNEHWTDEPGINGCDMVDNAGISNDDEEEGIVNTATDDVRLMKLDEALQAAKEAHEGFKMNVSSLRTIVTQLHLKRNVMGHHDEDAKEFLVAVAVAKGTEEGQGIVQDADIDRTPGEENDVEMQGVVAQNQVEGDNLVT